MAVRNPSVDDESSSPSGVSVLDGTTGHRCPICSGHTVSGQGLYSCLDCSWHGIRGV